MEDNSSPKYKETEHDNNSIKHETVENSETDSVKSEEKADQADHVLMFLAEEGILDNGFKIRNLYLPDTFIQHGDVNDMYAQAGLTSENIVKLVMKALDINNNEFKIIKS